MSFWLRGKAWSTAPSASSPTETVTEQEQVGGEVRQEHIEVEGQDQVRRRDQR
jgi:hypothetical protein